MKKILVVDLGEGEDRFRLAFREHEVEVERRGCGGDVERARRLVQEHDGAVDAIALDGLSIVLELGGARARHHLGEELAAAAVSSPVVDGSGVRSGLERWGISLADRAEPGIFSQKRVLMTPGLNHSGMARGLHRLARSVRYADPEILFGLPDFPGVGSQVTLHRVAGPTLERLRGASFPRIACRPEEGGRPRAGARFRWADVLAGDACAIRRFGPSDLKGKTVVVPWAGEEDVEELRRRNVRILVTLLPSFEPESERARRSAAVLEGMLVAIRSRPDAPLSEDTYLQLLADLEWRPAIRYLRQDEAGLHRFAFVIHPLEIGHIHRHPAFRWTRYLPDALVESVAAWLPPMYISRVTGGRSPVTDQRVEGHLFSLGATPRQMMKRDERFTYARLTQAARMAERRGCRLMGLGAFTSVVGDAGVTVAQKAGIAVTSGNSLTVAATLEAAKQGVLHMGAEDLTRGKAMIIGATGSIGSVCSRLLAQAIANVVLVSIEPEKLIELKRTIERETPGARVTIATRPRDLVADCDLIVTATSAFGQRILDISECKPGAVICDVARPPDVGAAEAALRPDLLVIESGEVRIPGDVDFGYDIGLPPKTAYACLAETALLAMEGRFESFTLGREIDMERVKEIYRLFKRHRFELAGLRSFGRYLTPEDFARKRELARRLRADPQAFDELRREAAGRLASIPAAAKGVRSGSAPPSWTWWAAAGVGASLAAAALIRRRRARAAGPSTDTRRGKRKSG